MTKFHCNQASRPYVFTGGSRPCLHGTPLQNTRPLFVFSRISHSLTAQKSKAQPGTVFHSVFYLTVWDMMKWKDSEGELRSSPDKSPALKGSNLMHWSSILWQVHNLNPQYGGLISLVVPPTVIHSFNHAHHEFSWLKFDSLSRYLNICRILSNKTPWILMSLLGRNTLKRGIGRTSKIRKKKKRLMQRRKTEK